MEYNDADLKLRLLDMANSIVAQQHSDKNYVARWHAEQLGEATIKQTSPTIEEVLETAAKLEAFVRQ